MARSNPIPEDYQEEIGELAQHPAYIAAWRYAKSKANSDKGCRIYADARWQEYEDGRAPGEKSEQDLREEIERLQEALAAKEQGAQTS